MRRRWQGEGSKKSGGGGGQGKEREGSGGGVRRSCGAEEASAAAALGTSAGKAECGSGFASFGFAIGEDKIWVHDLLVVRDPKLGMSVVFGYGLSEIV